MSFDQLPDEIVHTATQRLIDTVGCALAGARCDAASIGRRIAAGAVLAAHAGRILCFPECTTAEC